MDKRVSMIRSSLEKSLTPERIDIIDNSAAHASHPGNTGGGHFHVTIVADKFHDKTTLQRHQMVYAAVSHLIPSEIHALSIKAMAPEEL